jgi:hypothetical protein
MVEERFASAAIEQKAGACEDAGIRLKLSLTLLLAAAAATAHAAAERWPPPEVCFDDVKLVKN